MQLPINQIKVTRNNPDLNPEESQQFLALVSQFVARHAQFEATVLEIEIVLADGNESKVVVKKAVQTEPQALQIVAEEQPFKDFCAQMIAMSNIHTEPVVQFFKEYSNQFPTSQRAQFIIPIGQLLKAEPLSAISVAMVWTALSKEFMVSFGSVFSLMADTELVLFPCSIIETAETIAGYVRASNGLKCPNCRDPHVELVGLRLADGVVWGSSNLSKWVGELRDDDPEIVVTAISYLIDTASSAPTESDAPYFDGIFQEGDHLQTIVTLCDSQNTEIMSYATILLSILARDTQLTQRLVVAGVVEKAISLVSRFEVDDPILIFILQLIVTLADHDTLKLPMAEAGAISVGISLVTADDPMIENAAIYLLALLSADPKLLNRLVIDGVIEALIHKCAHPSDVIQEQVMLILWNLSLICKKPGGIDEFKKHVKQDDIDKYITPLIYHPDATTRINVIQLLKIFNDDSFAE